MRPPAAFASRLLRLTPAALLPAGLLVSGCQDLDRFTTAPSESYCGSVTLSSEFRTGLSPKVQMRLQLDATQLDGDLSPGVLWTYEAPDGSTPAVRLLERAPLRRIPKLENDPLSQLDLGEGRDQNRIFAATPSDEAEEALLVFLTLRNDDGVEVRLLRPGLAPLGSKPAPAGRTPIFGLFTLYKRVGTCEF